MKTLTYLPQKITAEEIDSAVEFDYPFLVNEDGTVELSGNHGPHEVFGNYYADGSIYISSGWEAWSHGYTGQHGYDGPALHDSEYLGGRIAEDILSEPGEYCICAIYYLPEDDDESTEPEMEIEGWLVVKATK